MFIYQDEVHKRSNKQIKDLWKKRRNNETVFEKLQNMLSPRPHVIDTMGQPAGDLTIVTAGRADNGWQPAPNEQTTRPLRPENVCSII